MFRAHFFFFFSFSIFLNFFCLLHLVSFFVAFSKHMEDYVNSEFELGVEEANTSSIQYFRMSLQPEYDNVYWLVRNAHIDPFPISNEHWRYIICTAQRMKLSPFLLQQGIIKQNWLLLFAKYKKVTGYVVDEENVLLGHWTMYLRLESSSNDIHHAKMELKCHELTDDSPYYEHISYANNQAVEAGSYYILTNFSVDSRLTDTPRYLSCNVQWTDMWVSYGLDEQHFKPYNKVYNNCRQFVQRVCRRVCLSVTSNPIVDEKLANKLRSECHSTLTWYEWTLSVVAGIFYPPKFQSNKCSSNDD